MTAYAVAAIALVVLGLGGLAAWAIVAMLDARATAADAAERRFNLLEAVGDGVYILDDDLRFTHVNEEAERLLGVIAGDLVGKRLVEIVDPLASDLVPEVRYARRTGNVVTRTHASPAGGRWIEIRVKPAARETLIALRDVSTRTRAEQGIREGEQRLRLVTGNVDAVLWTTDLDARFTQVAGGALGELGLVADELVGNPSSPLIAEHALREVYAGAPVRAETARGDRWLRHHVEPLRDVQANIVGAVGVSLDVTELKRVQQRLYETAHRDALTGLPNRLSIEQRLRETIDEARRDERRFALLFVDLDRFKTINDTLGHGIGDDVLREVASRLQETLRAGDVIARPGGDEFIILVPRVAHVDEVDAVGRRLVRSLAAPIAVRGRELFVSASVGAAIYPEHGDVAEALVAHADAAMYRAKAFGGNRHALFDATMEAAATERLSLENDLRHALYRDELRLEYQPVVDVLTHRIVGCEALVRWHHKTRGIVAPNDFIGIAEETGVIVALDRWVLNEACATAARLRRSDPDFRVAVNLSPRDLREPDLPEVVAAVLSEHGLPASALAIEVTESVALDDSVLPALRRLCGLGVTVAVDDFGTGYSSLSYLKRLPVTALKIDRAFIRDVASDAYDQAIVGSIVGIAKALGLHITAEGLETEEQVDYVTQLGCDHAQGFRFGRPLAASALAELVEQPYVGELVKRGA